MAQELVINANLHITGAPYMFEDVIHEQGIKLYAYTGGEINGDVYMAWNKVLEYPERVIKVSGYVIFE